MYHDNEGFIVLDWKKPLITKESNNSEYRDKENKQADNKLSKNNKTKTKQVKFKKGSWKNVAWKILKKAFIPNSDRDFNSRLISDLLVGFHKDSNKSSKVIETNEGFTLDQLQNFKSKFDRKFVLIKASHNTYLKVSLKSYRKLREIKRMYILFVLEVELDDGTTSEALRQEKIITNINELAYYVTHHQHCVDGIYQLEAESCGFVTYGFNFKLVVEKNDGKVETYKGDMNEFMLAYDLDPF